MGDLYFYLRCNLFSCNLECNVCLKRFYVKEYFPPTVFCIFGVIFAEELLCIRFIFCIILQEAIKGHYDNINFDTVSK